MTKPLRIAQVVGNLETGGTQTLIMELMRRLDRGRFDSSIIHFKDPNHFAGEIAERKWRCMKVRASRSYRPAEIRALAEVFTRERFDIVHTHSDFANFAARAAAICAGAPRIIAHYHNTYAHRMDAGFVAMESLLSERTDALIACSKGVQQFMQDHLDLHHRPLHLLQNGVDVAPFREVATARDKCRAGHGIPEETFHVVHTARLEPHKQPQLLVDALALMTREESHAMGSWRLTFVGGGSLRDALEQQLKQLDKVTLDRTGVAISERVIFAGWSRDIAQWLGSANVFCLVSRNEGLPLSLVEAMAAGTPTISPDIIGPQEVIEGAENGIMLKDMDPRKVLDALLGLRANPIHAAQIAANGRTRAEQFSIEKYVARAEELYTTVANQAVVGAPPLNPISRYFFLRKLSRLARKKRSGE
ncbi:glycosyltransferase family 4 protein [Candidatus Sumerlaeota bacterium]|nr:glycosyltransferase family 4 protein [Candidatus Sumerlaeota bacterium]